MSNVDTKFYDVARGRIDVETTLFVYREVSNFIKIHIHIGILL